MTSKCLNAHVYYKCEVFVQDTLRGFLRLKHYQNVTPSDSDLDKPILRIVLYEPRYEKPTFCICENKDADLLRGNREADQRLCFRYIDRTIPLLSKSKISSLYM